jgi:CheY-like chemotaxis protein
LRTPLNNLLILAQMLADNTEGTLTPKQVKYAETIHSSGTDLLSLINDILDLSKIESGKMDVEVGSVRFNELRDFCSRTFRHVADGKGLEFSIELDESSPEDTIITDAKRLQQVLKNLLSNALKFTASGSVRLRMERAVSGWSANHPVLNRVKSVIAFSVSDTGIGIPQDKQRIIFEAFQQADGTTSRKYGGTGLGLSISRELTRLLGGEIRLQSSPAVGSTFTLYLPQAYLAQVATVEHESWPVESGVQRPMVIPVDVEPGTEEAALDIILLAPLTAPTAVVHDIEIDDDRNLIQPGDPVLLIIEDDATFARILVDLARDRCIRPLVALRGATALTLAGEFLPGAITLDINLPDVAGWTILDRLKHDPATRHIPVHVITGDENRRRGLALGAMTYLEKSAGKDNLNAAFDAIHNSLVRRTRKLLVVTEAEARITEWQELLGGSDVEILAVRSGGEALATVRQKYLDAIVLDLDLTDIPRVQLVEEIRAQTRPQAPPMVICGPPNPSGDVDAEIRRLALHGVVRYAESPNRLLEETVVFLHRADADLTGTQREILNVMRRSDSTLAGKKILVVDDDVRNIFALTTVLEQHNLNVLHAENGKTGIETLLKKRDIDAVLMDIMMPEMDGYETIRAIRQIEEFRALPIIAVTAKAMKGDRAKCIEAGASDYITKPVDLDQLFSVLRVGMVRGYESAPPATATVAG